MKKRYLILALALVMGISALCGACANNGSGSQSGSGQSTKPSLTPLPDNPLTLKADSVEANVGDNFSIILSLEGNEDYANWAAFETVINYDPSLFSIDSVETTENTKDVMLTPNLELADNKVKVAIATPRDMDFGQIVELKCTAKAAGTAEVTFEDEKVYCMVIYGTGAGEFTTLPAALQKESFTVTVK